MRIWLYYRLSRDEDDELNSLTNQRKIIYDYATQQGYEIVGESFDDNVSGMHFNREGIDKIYEIVDARGIDAVLVKDLSRLGRHRTQTALFIDYLREKHRYAGLLKCGDCGAPFVPMIRWWNGKRRVEYVCKSYMTHGKEYCTSHRIHEEALDAVVVQEITAQRDRLQAKAKIKKQEQKKWASSKYLLDAQIAALQKKIQSLDADIESLLMERIQDKANAVRYDSLIAKLSSEQAAARQGLDDLQSSGTNLHHEMKSLDKRIAELSIMLGHTTIDEELMRQFVIQIVLTLAEKEVSVTIKCTSAD